MNIVCRECKTKYPARIPKKSGTYLTYCCECGVANVVDMDAEGVDRRKVINDFLRLRAWCVELDLALNTTQSDNPDQYFRIDFKNSNRFFGTLGEVETYLTGLDDGRGGTE